MRSKMRKLILVFYWKYIIKNIKISLATFNSKKNLRIHTLQKEEIKFLLKK